MNEIISDIFKITNNIDVTIETQFSFDICKENLINENINFIDRKEELIIICDKIYFSSIFKKTFDLISVLDIDVNVNLNTNSFFQNIKSHLTNISTTLNNLLSNGIRLKNSLNSFIQKNPLNDIVYWNKLEKDINQNSNIMLQQMKNINDNILQLEFLLKTLQDLSNFEKNIVIIGANGSGKTSFALYLSQMLGNIGILVSAQKILKISPLNSIPLYTQNELTNIQNKRNIFKNDDDYYNNQEDLNSLIKHLISCHITDLDKYRKDSKNNSEKIEAEETLIEKAIRLWNDLIKTREICFESNQLKVKYSSTEYPLMGLSDGEKVLLYNIIQVLLAPKDGFIIIDEPEIFLNNSIIKRIWDELEFQRQDCKFIYVTHNFDFVVSRKIFNKIWIKSYYPTNNWEFSKLEGNSINEELYLELLGNRTNVIFTEGEKESYDAFIYQALFPEFNIYPLGSCSKVIEATKVFNELGEFHNLSAIGIIDRDRKMEEELEGLKKKKIFSPLLAEIENFFLTDEAIEVISKCLRKESSEISEIKENVKNKVFSIFQTQLKNQCYEYSKYEAEKEIKKVLTEKNENNDFEEYITDSLKQLKTKNFIELYNEIEKKFQSIINDKRYEDVLKVFNFKGLIGASKVAELFNIHKKEAYVELILKILKENSKDGEELRRGLKRYIPIS